MSERTEVESSNLRALTHRPDGRVEIEFVRSQDIYVTELPVAPEVYRDWLMAESVGTYFSKHIQDTYRPLKKTIDDDKIANADTTIERPLTQLTVEQILVQVIATEVNRWLNQKGEEALRYPNQIDRVAELSLLIRGRAIPWAAAIIAKATSAGDQRLIPGGRITLNQ